MTQTTAAQAPSTEKDPWPALFALVVGFFMIMVDTTITAVATPAIIKDLNASVTSVVWVTSAYLLAYAVPVLITGRLGDRYGPKNLYIIGLTVFTAASLWCGLTTTVGALIVARVVQGLGASMITPQTMAIITRIFPAERRGKATALWGATAGVALVVGPLLGGILVDWQGWQWIFYVNIPVGVIALAMAVRLLPKLDNRSHHFDWLGVVLSGIAMFGIVFGIQEGHDYHWGKVTGFISVPLFIIGGLLFGAVFVLWQARGAAEPLVPLSLFRERNFSLSNVGIMAISFSFTAMGFPLMIWAQVVRGLSPTHAAMMMLPLAIMSIVLAPKVGQLTDRIHPSLIVGTGFAGVILGFVSLSLLMNPHRSLFILAIPMAIMGAGSAGVWAPLTATATRGLPMSLAGAGAGVYNAARQIGAVLGSAAIAVLMDSRLAAHGLDQDLSKLQQLKPTPAQLEAFHQHFSDSMAQSLLLPPAILVLGLAAVLFYRKLPTPTA
ncbi:MFS transporter [Nocardioides baekrokdamisoli]|uniref:MFS transporter n=1 Tax=Nocardioides baekrokdamisoli TaxID=1804624 RepID=A0A3G9J2N2_9ACTN|nr:MFS transporter [Nocardioides baekrokdamisoli]BBH17259.1 MFS transporter [Nocardioides baekrokdamisoli]